MKNSPMPMSVWPMAALAGLALLVLRPAHADDTPFAITIKNHQFQPGELTIPAGQKIKIIVRNQDPVTAEFESLEFHREKLVQAGQEITVFVGPLDPGTYEYFDDFHPESRGHLIAK